MSKYAYKCQRCGTFFNSNEAVRVADARVCSDCATLILEKAAPENIVSVWYKIVWEHRDTGEILTSRTVGFDSTGDVITDYIQALTKFDELFNEQPPVRRIVAIERVREGVE